MARTAAGAALTHRHRQAQLQVRAATLRDFMRLWPLWQGDARTFRLLVDAAIPLVRVHHSLSSSLATTYFETFRRLERVGGSASPVPSPGPDVDKVAAGLWVTGHGAARDAIAAGLSPQAAMQTALTRTSGSITRQVLEGGRTALVESTSADRQARGWMRVTGDACAFCGMLASRAGAYLSEESAGFQAHDHCACSAEPSYSGSSPPPSTERWDQLWNDAQREAHATGEIERLKDEGAANPALSAFRSFLARQ